MLLPPPPPGIARRYDFQRQAYFQRIGAVGYALEELRLRSAPETGGFGEWLERLRQRITERIIASLPSPTGALAAAQITGHRNHPARGAERDAGSGGSRTSSPSRA